MVDDEQEKRAAAALAEMPEAKRKLVEKLGEEEIPVPRESVATEETEPDETAPPDSEAKTDPDPKEPEKKTPEESEEQKRYETMSKALQKVQQDIATLVKKREKQGGELTEQQQEKLDEAIAKTQTLRDDLSAVLVEDPYSIDVYTAAPKLGKAILAQEDRLAKLEDDNRNLRERLDTADKAPEVEAYWKQEATDHEGVDVKGIWNNSLKAAESRPAVKNAQSWLEQKNITQAQYQEALRMEASEIYHERVKTAKASVAGKKLPPPTPLPTARRAPPNTPSGTRLAQNPGGSPATQTYAEKQEALIMEKLAY